LTNILANEHALVNEKMNNYVNLAGTSCVVLLISKKPNMKKTILMLTLAFFAITVTTVAQQKKVPAEVLYFKANLACCKAKACDALEATVRSIIEKNWADGSVTFRQIKLSDTTNNELIKRYDAQSQTLLLVVTKKKIKFSTDLSAILRFFVSSNDTAKFEKDLIDNISEAIK
jgi:hypothetical protein